MNKTSRFLRAPHEEYGDDVLYGPRIEAQKAEARTLAGKFCECIIRPLGTAYVNKREVWTLRNLVGQDPRLRTMMETSNLKFGLSLQRVAWPHIDRAEFPIVAISPESTGKTYTHLLYCLSKVISQVPIATTNIMLSPDEAFDSYTSSKADLINSIEQLCLDHDNIDFDQICKGSKPERTLQKGDEIQVNNHSDILEQPTKLTTEEHLNVNMDEFYSHPQYIVITSNHQKVEQLTVQVRNLKLAAFGTQRHVKNRLDDLPPKTRSLDIHLPDPTLALRCSEAALLLTTPGALIKCITSDYIKLNKCKKIFFDDLDLALQLQSHNIKTLIKHFLASTRNDEWDESIDAPTEECMIYMFARKWTELVKTFINSTFKQIILIFGSIAEAAILANMRCDLEKYADPRMKLSKLINTAKLILTQEPADQKIGIICRDSREAEQVSMILNDREISTIYLPDGTSLLSLKNKLHLEYASGKLFYSMSDEALDLVVQELNDISCIIHFSMPTNMLTFDQRFKLMFSHIEDPGKHLQTILFLSSKFDPRNARELYDMMSRSATTLQSTKFEIRDMIKVADSSICWRWASMGACRLDKFSKGDRFGTFCSEKHSLAKRESNQKGPPNRWPRGGQLKITVTHLVSPNEFFFWFEAHRDSNSVNKKWSKLESTGSDFMLAMQQQLDMLKNTNPYSVPLRRLRKGKIYGVYFAQEKRVDRVKLLNDIQIDEDLIALSESGYQFTEQCQVIKIDYGYRIHVFMKNLFELPENLANIEPQCHRGFYVGVKPIDNEPEWHFNAKQKFYDLFCLDNLQEVRVWLRLNSDNCFWFESMEILETMRDFSDKYLIRPHDNLVQNKLADVCRTEPSCLEPSERLQTESNWHVDMLLSLVQYAYLRRDKEYLDVFLLHIMNDLTLRLRLVDLNKQLIELEACIMEDFRHGKLRRLEYFKPETICLAKVIEDPNSLSYTINRCKLLGTVSGTNDMDQADNNELVYQLLCLDHGDVVEVPQTSLYLPHKEHISLMPFQSINCQLQDLNKGLLEKSESYRYRIQDVIYDLSRDKDDQLIVLKCKVGSDKRVQLFVPVEKDGYLPLETIMTSQYEVELVTTNTLQDPDKTNI